MTATSSYPRRRRAVARVAVKAVPSLPMVVGLYFLSMGLLSLALALHRA
ncbi:hypothetical protein FHW37_109120 [Neorhizobium alkalisoli]|jgi:hypothetical protein|uniref:Uncharacterized protein n=1 Tax=Neorhizobium alkalisoli TaxID=528178 RepID=A0A561QCG7_9HYPH|nr:hypothetical protein FHW37_109120 [Neorhizobium alkalisoli]